jgi:hypothetical protein
VVLRRDGYVLKRTLARTRRDCALPLSFYDSAWSLRECREEDLADNADPGVSTAAKIGCFSVGHNKLSEYWC